MSAHLSVNWGMQGHAGLSLSLSNCHWSLSNCCHWRGHHLSWIDNLSVGHGHCLHQTLPFVEATSWLWSLLVDIEDHRRVVTGGLDGSLLLGDYVALLGTVREVSGGYE